MMNIKIIPFTSNDLELLIKLHLNSFQSTSFHQSIFSNVSIQNFKLHLLKSFNLTLNDTSGKRLGLKVINEDDIIVGYCLMEERGRNGGIESVESIYPEGTNIELIKYLKEQEATVSEHYLRLRILAIDPKYQKLGIGTALLTHCMKYADSKRLEIYLVSSHDVKPFYLSHSFLTFGKSSYAPSSTTPSTHLLIRLPFPLAPIVISPAKPEDAYRLAQIHRFAFSPYSLHKTLYGNCLPSELDNCFKKRFEGIIGNNNNNNSDRDGDRGGGEILLKATCGNKGLILGFAYWELPSPSPPPSTSSTPAPPPPTFSPRYHAPLTNLPLAIPFFKTLDLHSTSLPNSKNSYHLHIIATEPSFQKKGIAFKLIEWGLKKSEEEGEGVRVYLDATREGEPVYVKIGFRRILGDEDILVGEGESRVFPMVWEPVNSKMV